MNFYGTRHQVLSDNISRVNMPKEKAFDLPSLTSATMHKKLPMMVTETGHMAGNKSSQNFKIIPMPDAQELTMNGNNINLEQQTTKLAENSTDYTLVANMYKRIKALRKLPFSSNV
ncbi:Flagellar basal body rod protein FlgB [Rickettsiales bacterium Ac37b]|nr:Flagellar basal body rod protein FlgB [Rickettsiales bacterium Ac37b]